MHWFANVARDMHIQITGFDWEERERIFEPGSNTQMFSETRNGV